AARHRKARAAPRRARALRAARGSTSTYRARARYRACSSGCSRRRSGAGSGKSARRGATAAVPPLSMRHADRSSRRSFVDLEPLPLDRERDERLDVGAETRRVVGALEISDDLAERPRAVAAAQDRAGAAVELHDAFGIEQHVSLLRRLPLQAEVPTELRLRRCRDRAHSVTP